MQAVNFILKSSIFQHVFYATQNHSHNHFLSSFQKKAILIHDTI